jgi:hypothetical protein
MPRDKQKVLIIRTREKKVSELTALYERSMSDLKSGYSPSMVETFSQQSGEAKGLAVGTEMIDRLAAGHGVTRAEISARISGKADYFARYSGVFLAAQQVAYKNLTALSDDDIMTASIEDIWEYQVEEGFNRLTDDLSVSLWQRFKSMFMA